MSDAALLSAYRQSFGANVAAGQLLLPDSLKLLPLYTLALLKSVMFRPGQDVRPAERIAAINVSVLMANICFWQLKSFICIYLSFFVTYDSQPLV